MTSLIFGSIYLAHKGATGAYRDKQRRKNYERWEGLRDEYDAQKKITRDTRSLDLQRTGSMPEDDRPIVSLRDLQEANDARTAWRPQESWEHSNTNTDYNPAHVQPQTTAYRNPTENLSRSSTSSNYWQSRGEIRPQRTGATWDDNLPAPLRVTRRSLDETNSSSYAMQRQGSNISSRSSSTQSPPTPPQHSETEPVAMNAQFLQQLTGMPPVKPVPVQTSYHSNEYLKNPVSSVYPVHSNSFGPASIPGAGGRMAELIERGY